MLSPLLYTYYSNLLIYSLIFMKLYCILKFHHRNKDNNCVVFCGLGLIKQDKETRDGHVIPIVAVNSH